MKREILLVAGCLFISSCTYKFSNYTANFGQPVWEGSGNFLENEVIITQENSLCFDWIDGTEVCVPNVNVFRVTTDGEVEICNSLLTLSACSVVFKP